MNGKTARLIRRMVFLRWLRTDRRPETYRKFLRLMKAGWLRASRRERARIRRGLLAEVLR